MSDTEHSHVSVEQLREQYGEDEEERPLTGIRVLSFAWVHAGPLAGSILGQLGADVIKIESTKRPDFLRFTFPRAEGADPEDPEQGGLFQRLNLGGKRSLNLNMSHDRADEVFEPLVEEADVVLENFTASAMAEMGWPSNRFREVNPEIVYVSAASYGHTGPKSDYRGYGSTIDATTGIIQQNGYPDLHPMNHQTSYPDSVGGVTMAYATMSALIEREQTGEGQHVDLDQVEATTSLNGAAVLETSVNGEVPPIRGNRHREHAPHGVYPCAGDNEWVAIAIRTDEEWRSLRTAMDDPNSLPVCESATDRHRAHEEIDETIAAWTGNRGKETVVEVLQQHGVPVGAVQTQADIVNEDEHLQDREALQVIDHEVVGPRPYQALPFKYSKTVENTRGPAPMLGEHTREVVRELTTLDNSEIDDLIEADVLV